MLEIGERIPDAEVWIGPRERVPFRSLIEDAPAIFLFYLFDWSST